MKLTRDEKVTRPAPVYMYEGGGGGGGGSGYYKREGICLSAIHSVMPVNSNANLQRDGLRALNVNDLLERLLLSPQMHVSIGAAAMSPLNHSAKKGHSES